MNIYFLLACGLIALVTFIGFILASIDNYKKHYKFAYNIRNYYPYELDYQMRFSENIVGNCLLIISVLAGFACYSTGFFIRLDAFSIVISIVGMLASLIPLGLVFVPLTKGRAHIIVVCLAFLVAFINNGMIAIDAYRMFSKISAPSGLASFIISVLVCVAIFIMIMNPKISRWASMIEQKNIDGTVSYIRPKYFVLAFSEWLLMFSNFVALIAFYLLELIAK